MKNVFLFLASFSLLVSCSKGPSSATNGATSQNARVTRGNSNQPSIQIVGPVRDSVEADALLFEEQGYQTAYDRFLQMDVFRRSAQGKLAELFGPKAYEQDLAAIGRGFTIAIDSTSKLLKKSHPESYYFLQRYSYGVNKFLKDIQKNKPEWAKLYKQISKQDNYVPLAWTPEDSIAITTYLQFYLSNSLNEKFSLGVMYYLLTAIEQVDDFFHLVDLRPIRNAFIFEQPVAGFEIPTVKTMVERVAYKFAPMLSYQCKESGFGLPNCTRPSSVGSNNWVVSNRLTKNGETYLANDPHLLLTLPGLLHEVNLNSKSAGGTLRVKGLTPPGVIGILIGHNDRVAWGLTNFPADVDDNYLEIVNANETLAKNADEKWVPISETFVERSIRENGVLKPKKISLKVVPGHGPLISNFQAGIKAATMYLEEDKNILRITKDQKIASSYRWTGHEGGGEVPAMLGVARCDNFSQFKEALQSFQVGAQNMIFADVDGNIGYYSHAKLPIRKYLTPGRPPYIPVQAFEKEDGLDGKEVAREWSGYRADFLEMYNPDKGYIVTANNDPVGMSSNKTHFDYKNYLGFGFDFGHRAARIEQLINEFAGKGGVTFEDMKRIQNDVKDLAALDFIAIINKIKLVGSLEGAPKEAVTRLLNWDGNATADKTEPALIYYWLLELVKESYDYNKVRQNANEANANRPKPKMMAVFRSEMLKEDYRKAWNGAVNNVFLSNILVKSIYHYYTDRISLAKKDSDLAKLRKPFAASLGRALAILEANEMQNSSWGRLNRLSFFNPLMGLMPSQFSMSIERGGSFSTVSPSIPGFYLGNLLNTDSTSTGKESSHEKKIKDELRRLNLYNDDEAEATNTRPGFGASFRIIFKLKKGQPIESQIVIPGGNWGLSEHPEKVADEIYMWRNGQYRDL